MSFKSIFASVFKVLGSSLGAGLKLAVDSGLKDEVVKQAVIWVKTEATNQVLDNEQRREFVVKALMKQGASESTARLATELAVKIVRQELNKV